MRNFQKAIAIIALSGLCFAAPAPSDSQAKAKKGKQAKNEATADQIKDLKAMIEQQQAALQQVQQQLQQTQQQLQQTQQQLGMTTQTAKEAETKAATVDATNLQVQKVQADLSDVKAAADTANQEAKMAVKKVTDLESPNSVAYKGIHITPAGFVEATGYFRSRATLSDQATPFQSIPLEHYAAGTYPGTEASYNPNLTETGFTPRDSRIAFRLDADPTKTAKLAAYYEMDFLSAASTANPNQTSSYNPRIRQAWARAKFANGWTITGGQMWNLITLNRKGTDADNSNIWIPNIIEAQYSIGYDWGRFGAVRVSKQLNPKMSFALEVVNASSLTQANNTTAGVAGLASIGDGLDANSLATGCTIVAAVPPSTTPSILCTNTPTYSTNMAPDTVIKLTYDSKFGHFEVKGVDRFFRDRVLPTATGAGGYNNTAIGGGVGAGAIIPVVSKKVDFIIQGLYGKGISRYQDAGQYDFVLSSITNNLVPVRAFSALAGFETHPTRKTELDLLFGEEYYERTLYVTSAPGAATKTYGGYGVPTATNTGCYYENLGQYQQTHSTATALPACTGNNRVLWNGKIYGYYDLFKGPHGTLRYGAEYDYDYRQAWSGSGGTLAPGVKSLAPKGIDNTAFVTMRYILP